MKNKLILAFLGLISASSIATAQDARSLWSDPPELFQNEPVPRGGPQGRGGQVVEEWYAPNVKGSLSLFGRVSFLSNTDVTVDHLWYTDFFDPGFGFSVEADLLTFPVPYWGVGGYVSYNWDRFDGNRINFSNGDFVEADQMTLNSVFVGGKVLQRLSPWVSWEGRIGLGLVTYSHVEWSGFDSSKVIPEFSHEELFQRITRGAFEIGGRIGAGSPNVQAEFGFGIRIMGGASRGRDVNSNVDPDYLTTFMLELGLALRF
jgi:hypothetical protein